MVFLIINKVFFIYYFKYHAIMSLPNTADNAPMKPPVLSELMREIMGKPRVSISLRDPLGAQLESYTVPFGRLSIPPLPRPLLVIYSLGNPLSYVFPAQTRPAQLLPGLVTVIPERFSADLNVVNSGDILVIYSDTRNVDDPLEEWAQSLPTSLHNFTSELIPPLAKRIAGAAEKARPGDQPAAEHINLLGQALTAELRAVLPRGNQQSTNQTPRAFDYVNRVLPIMHQRLAEPLPLKLLAREAGIGVTVLTSSFQAITGKTPHRYLLEARVERGAELLRNTHLSLADIAAQTGLSSQSHFNLVFKRYFGVTPRSYRLRFTQKRVGG